MRKGKSVDTRFLIYADDYIVWDKDKGDWGHNDEYVGEWLDAHHYAHRKYGKKYTMWTENGESC